MIAVVIMAETGHIINYQELFNCGILSGRFLLFGNEIAGRQRGKVVRLLFFTYPLFLVTEVPH